MLAHFQTVFVAYVPEHNAVLKGRFIEQQRGNGQQRVKPTARLIHRLGNEIGGERLLEHLFVFERIVVLRKRHTARIEPTVDHFGRAVHHAAAFASKRHFVHIRFVQFYVALQLAKRFEFFFTAHNVRFAALVAHPNGQRRAPIAIARQAPIDHVFQKVAHAPRADTVGHPMHGGVVFYQSVAHFGHFDKPSTARVIQQRRVATPTKRIAVRIRHHLEQGARFF